MEGIPALHQNGDDKTKTIAIEFQVRKKILKIATFKNLKTVKLP